MFLSVQLVGQLERWTWPCLQQTEQIPRGEELGLCFSKHQLPNLPSHWAIQIKVSSELSKEEFICAANSVCLTMKHLLMEPKIEAVGREGGGL
jgi:hypothetical protein